MIVLTSARDSMPAATRVRDAIECNGVAIHEENAFFQNCHNVPKLVEYYRSLCNLGLSYLNEAGDCGEHND